MDESEYFSPTEELESLSKLLTSTIIKVPGAGPIDTCKIAMIGEAAGRVEAERGEPFVGRSGMLLMDIMQNLGLLRSQVYLTNVVKERPPNNNISIFIDIKSNGRVVRTPEFDAYVEELKDELSRCSANVLVPLGNIALYTLTGLSAVTKRRGSILESTLLPGRKVIPMIHPRAALEQFIWRRYMSFDLARVIEESLSPEIDIPKRDIRIGVDFEATLTDLAHLRDASIISYDIEVLGTEVSCISLGCEHFTRSIPFVKGGTDCFDPDDEIAIWTMIAEILEDTKVCKVGQNILFDSHFLHHKYGIRSRNIDDTMIGMGILYPDFPKGLDFITSIYTKEPYYKDDGKKWFKFGGHMEDLWLYNAKDSAVTLEAHTPIQKDLKRQGNTQTYEWQLKLVEPLLYMQERGIRIDVEGKKLASIKATEQVEVLEAELLKLTGTPLNANSSQQLQDYFYYKKRIKPYINRKTHKPTVDINALKRIARKGVDEAQIILKIRTLKKLQSTYYEMKLSEDGRMRCSYNPVGTVSLRLSSSKDIFGVGGNSQNLPKAFKRLMLADEGYIIYEVDLSQAENREVAYFAPEPLMIKAFEEGIDIHSQTASLISGLPYDEVIAQNKENIPCPIGGGIYTWRFWGKKTNHGLNYDEGYKTFAFINEIPDHEARVMVERYHQIYPGVRQNYHTWVKSQLAKDRSLTNPYGHKRLFMDRWGDELFKSAFSFLPQSTTAHKINVDGIEYIYYDQDLFRYVELLNQVHDSTAFQIPIPFENWTETASIILNIKASLEQSIKWRAQEFKIPAEFKMGLNMGQMEAIKIDESTTIEGLADQLARIYRALRTTKDVPTLDGDIDDSVLTSEEGSLTLGNA
jgi:uracil-DNA glycosylase family 4